MAEQAGREKCTCDLERSGTNQNGAWVKNATACWLTEFHQSHWCDISVESLEGSQSHSALVQTLFKLDAGGSDLVRAFQTQFENFIGTTADDGKATDDFDRQTARDAVPVLLKDKQEEIGECVNAFRDASFGKGGKSVADEEKFRCSVGQESGWLRMEFRIGDDWLVYALSPKR
ncbi:hypothetical protein [Mesorhizobium sp.]|uniref:hypothetical protein n=1 Tax=Mesorhizobium sp. TaxID=1871066 RepID=UPI000FE6A0D2|nr:hypothetical protein [Mesorhizobium sp.]RWM10442.1 MAG: hypothetical protein EOR71_06700 [Mesorhizobium sp.]